MKNTRTLGKLGAGIAAVSLGLLGVGITATPAMAEPQTIDITTSTLSFTGVNPYSGQIDDVASYDSVNGIRGWNNDGLDNSPNDFTISDGVNSWDFFANSSTSTINQGGLSTITMTATTNDRFSVEYTVALTLTLEGNYARWSYAITGGDTSGLTVAFLANVGSDGGTVYDISGNTMVSHDDNDDNVERSGDPVVGWSVDTNGTFGGFDVVDEDDSAVALSATGASTFALTQVFQGYEPTAQSKATTFVKSLLQNLNATFGASYAHTRAPFLEIAPVTLTKGVAVNTVLNTSVSTALFDAGYFGNAPGQVGAVYANVPAGLTLTFGQDNDFKPVFTLTGTPTESGDFAADITLYRIGGGGEERAIAPDDAVGSDPVSATAAITVPAVVTPAAPTTTAPAPKASLAATGFDGMILVGFGGLAAAAGILLVAATRRRRA